MERLALAFRMVVALLIIVFEHQEEDPAPENIRYIVDYLIDVYTSADGGDEHHDKQGCTLIMEADDTYIEALIDCYVMDRAYVVVSIEGQHFRIGYTVLDDEILPEVHYNGANLLA